MHFKKIQHLTLAVLLLASSAMSFAQAPVKTGVKGFDPAEFEAAVKAIEPHLIRLKHDVYVYHWTDCGQFKTLKDDQKIDAATYAYVKERAQEVQHVSTGGGGGANGPGFYVSVSAWNTRNFGSCLISVRLSKGSLLLSYQDMLDLLLPIQKSFYGNKQLAFIFLIKALRIQGSLYRYVGIGSDGDGCFEDVRYDALTVFDVQKNNVFFKGDGFYEKNLPEGMLDYVEGRDGGRFRNQHSLHCSGAIEPFSSSSDEFSKQIQGNYDAKAFADMLTEIEKLNLDIVNDCQCTVTGEPYMKIKSVRKTLFYGLSTLVKGRRTSQSLMSVLKSSCEGTKKCTISTSFAWRGWFIAKYSCHYPNGKVRQFKKKIHIINEYPAPYLTLSCDE